MKYEDSKVKGIGKRTLRALERIAMEADYSLEERGGIDQRGGDSVDFLEVGVFGIQQMLEKSYLLGKEDGIKKAQKEKPVNRITDKGLKDLVICYLDVAVGVCDFSRVETMEGLVEMIGADLLEALGLGDMMREYLAADDRHDD